MTSRCTEPLSGAGFLGIGLALIGAAAAGDQSGLLGVGFACVGMALANAVRRYRGTRR